MRKGRRRRFGGSSRRARPLDWVCTQTAYDLRLPAILQTVNTGNDWIPISGNPDVIGAFADAAASNEATGNTTFVPWLEQTCVRIKGTAWCWILPDTSWWNTLTGYAYIKFRVQVQKQLVSGDVTGGGASAISPIVIENSTTLYSPEAGNQSFMWEETVDFLAESSWGSLVVDPSLYVRKVPIDIKVQRRLERDEVIAFGWDYIGIDYNGDPVAFPDAAINFQIRALMRTIT